MKKSIRILLVLLCLAFVVGIGEMIVHAEEGESLAVEMLESEAVSEYAAEEDTVESEALSAEIDIDIGEVHEIVENSSSFSEAVIKIAERFGISIEDAEGLVADMKALGDKYLGESELWTIIKNDMSLNPEKYVVIALVILLLVALIAFMLKWIISNMGQLRTLKMNVASLKKSVDGDDSDEGKASSIRSLITAKNDEIKALEDKDAELEKEVIKLREEAARLTKEAAEVKKNTESALNVIQETALQIAQLLCIAMDKGKMPVVSKEARQIWYENAQAKIKAAASIEEENVDADKVDKTVQTV